jgi:hypothetical protein
MRNVSVHLLILPKSSTLVSELPQRLLGDRLAVRIGLQVGSTQDELVNSPKGLRQGIRVISVPAVNHCLIVRLNDAHWQIRFRKIELGTFPKWLTSAFGNLLRSATPEAEFAQKINAVDPAEARNAKT